MATCSSAAPAAGAQRRPRRTNPMTASHPQALSANPAPHGALWKCRSVGAGGKLSSRGYGHSGSTSSFPPSPTALGNRLLAIPTFPQRRRRFPLPLANQNTRLAPFGRSPGTACVTRGHYTLPAASPVRYNNPCPGSVPLAGFEVSPIGRFSGVPRGGGRRCRRKFAN